MKIALVCTGLGYIQRGFERFTAELFKQVENDLSMTLFGSHLNGHPSTVSLPCLKYDHFLKIFKGRNRDNYYFQQLSYAAGFIPFVVLGKYDIVHYSEPPLGHFLWHARKTFGFRYRLLFTDALGIDPTLDGAFFERPDHIQAVTPPHYDQLIREGVDSRKVTHLPYGVDSARYLLKRDKRNLREKYGVPQDKVVVLCIAALNRRHKRIDYLIQEVRRLGENYFLLVVGHPEEPDLNRLGSELLGERFKWLYVSFEETPELYALADLFVIPSLVEGFCLALVEAMCSGLPVISHDSPHFQWLIGDSRGLTDLNREGSLARKIEEVILHQHTLQTIAGENQKRAVERFDWERLKPRYLEMYQKVISHGN